MRWHGGTPAPVLDAPDPAAVEKGTANLVHHLGRLRGRGLPVVVAVNLHGGEAGAEVAAIVDAATRHGAYATVTHDAYRRGADGAIDLGEAVMAAPPGRFEPLVGHVGLRDGVEIRARRWYGADDVVWSARASAELGRLDDAGYGRLPVCIAKTHRSISHDVDLRGAPSGFSFPVRELRLAAGAGYVTALAGDVLSMPGLPAEPRFRDIDVGPDGRITGLV
jgi:formyltetrahydrofolate synthetase